MRNLISLCWIALLVIAGTAFADTSDVTGEWDGTMLGLSVTLTLSEDGTYTLAAKDYPNEEPTTGTWSLVDDTMISMDRGTDAEVVFIVSDDDLLSVFSKAKFTKGKSETITVESSETGYYDHLLSYEEYSELNFDWNADDPVSIEVIVGSVWQEDEEYYSCDLWIRGENGYHLIFGTYLIRKVNENVYYPFEPISGQKVILQFTPHFADMISDTHVRDAYVIEQGVDMTEIEKEYIASLGDEALLHIFEPFEESLFEYVSYKKVLRNIEDYAYMPIVIEGTYMQDLKDGYGLLSDTEGNIYRFYICQLSIMDDIIDFNLLLKDKIKIYGYVDEELYTYSSWAGERTVPHIVVRKVILLEDE